MERGDVVELVGIEYIVSGAYTRTCDTCSATPLCRSLDIKGRCCVRDNGMELRSPETTEDELRLVAGDRVKLVRYAAAGSAIWNLEVEVGNE